MAAMQDDGNNEPTIRVYGARPLNERKESGRILLASCDVHVHGIAIFAVVLSLNAEGEPRLSLPRPNGQRVLQFKDLALRAKIMAKCIETYRALAAKLDVADLTDPAQREWEAA